MATGKRNYFRHDFTTHRNTKHIQMYEELGLISYAHYFILAEKCAELLVNGKNFPLVFHESDLRKSLKVSKQNLEKFLTFVGQNLDICATFVEQKSDKSSTTVGQNVEITWPKLLKYIGQYNPKNAPNKKKLNEIKRNEMKGKERKLKKESEKEKSPDGSRELAPKPSASFLTIDNFQNFCETLDHAFQIELKQTYSHRGDQWIRDEITHAIEWNLGSGKKRNVNGWKAFLRTWLKKANQNSSVRNSNPQKTFAQMRSENNLATAQRLLMDEEVF